MADTLPDVFGFRPTSADDAALLRRVCDAVTRVDPDTRDVADAARAAAYHARRTADGPRHVVLIGGTGVGKSTLANRLARVPDRGPGALVGTSFRRTFTAGVVALGTPADGWLGLPHARATPADLPARGSPDNVTFVDADVGGIVLVDTPDVDGDVPVHHARAESAFRWADAVVLVATPEKYQLPESARYAQLADRWGLTRWFVLNKADDPRVADDWATQLGGGEAVYVVPRDDSALTPPPGRSLQDLRGALSVKEVRPTSAALATRYADVAGRVEDTVLAPARDRRRRADDAAARLRALVRPEAGVDVHPMTRHLQKRLRQQSVLYLMGPARMVERVRSLPGIVARLPRSTWDLVTRGRLSPTPADDAPPADPPDVARTAAESFDVFLARCDDALRDAGLPAGEGGWRLDASEARSAVQAEVDALRAWLEARWDKKPRDTRALEWLAKHLPGGQHVTRLSESAPYLLIAASAASNAVLGPVDQVVIGGYLLTTWLGERLSDEVAARSRDANVAIGRAFADACDRQVTRAVAWCGTQAPDASALAELESAVDALARRAEVMRG